MDNKKRNKTILKVTCDLLEKMNVEVKDAFVEDIENDSKVESRKLEVENKNEKGEVGVEGRDEQVLVGVEVENPAILIGFKGRTLMPLQFIVSLMVKKALDKWVRVLLDINGYRGEQKLRLEEKTKEAIGRAVASGDAVSLPAMSSFERRICHMAAAEIGGVASESEGEGWNRHVVVRPEGDRVKADETIEK